MKYYKDRYFNIKISGIGFRFKSFPQRVGKYDLQFLNDIQDILKISMSYTSRHT